jgi:hypothetical protein
MSLVGNRYIQATEPAAPPSTGYQWLDTDTSILYERNGANTAWIQVYNTNQTNGGLLPISGGSVTGSITGTTGWAPSDNANFATSAKIAGQNIATVNYVNQQVNSFNDLISAKVSQAIAASTTTSTANNNIAKNGIGLKLNGYFSPVSGPQNTAPANPNTAGVISTLIPLPSYPNGGGEAQESDCVWMASMALSYTDRQNLNVKITDNSSSNRYWISIFAQTTTNRQYQSVLYQGGATEMSTMGFGYTPMGMNWMIFAVNSAQ